MADPTAGVTLRAAEALPTQQTFTREQVAYLLRLAYDAGRTAAYREDLAEMHSVWEDRAERRRTYEDLVAARLAEMEQAARAVARRRQAARTATRNRRTQPVRGLLAGVEWPPVAQPGIPQQRTGRRAA